jgi:hypothetical protein
VRLQRFHIQIAFDWYSLCSPSIPSIPDKLNQFYLVHIDKRVSDMTVVPMGAAFSTVESFPNGGSVARIIGSLSQVTSGPRDPNQPGQAFACPGTRTEEVDQRRNKLAMYRKRELDNCEAKNHKGRNT